MVLRPAEPTDATTRRPRPDRIPFTSRASTKRSNSSSPGDSTESHDPGDLHRQHHLADTELGLSTGDTRPVHTAYTRISRTPQCSGYTASLGALVPPSGPVLGEDFGFQTAAAQHEHIESRYLAHQVPALLDLPLQRATSTPPTPEDRNNKQMTGILRRPLKDTEQPGQPHLKVGTRTTRQTPAPAAIRSPRRATTLLHRSPTWTPPASPS